jgi:hypothetical protein
MGRQETEQYLPEILIQRASLRGNEYAWRLDDIPLVIQAAKDANLVNRGGQLQFRIPNRGTCELHYVSVYTGYTVPKSLPWAERVEKTAIVALEYFNNLKTEYDFIHEGRLGFERYLTEAEASGYSLEDVICFVWYVESEQEAAEKLL